MACHQQRYYPLRVFDTFKVPSPTLHKSSPAFLQHFIPLYTLEEQILASVSSDVDQSQLGTRSHHSAILTLRHNFTSGDQKSFPSECSPKPNDEKSREPKKTPSMIIDIAEVQQENHTKIPEKFYASSTMFIMMMISKKRASTLVSPSSHYFSLLRTDYMLNWRKRRCDLPARLASDTDESDAIRLAEESANALDYAGRYGEEDIDLLQVPNRRRKPTLYQARKDQANAKVRSTRAQVPETTKNASPSRTSFQQIMKCLV